LLSEKKQHEEEERQRIEQRRNEGEKAASSKRVSFQTETGALVAIAGTAELEAAIQSPGFGSGRKWQINQVDEKEAANVGGGQLIVRSIKLSHLQRRRRKITLI
jgi:hypothetical protein